MKISATFRKPTKPEGHPGVRSTSGAKRSTCSCPCSDDEAPHDGKRCEIHGCHLSGTSSCEDTPMRYRCHDCPEVSLPSGNPSTIG